ncbi:MAG: DUF1295 domain-containing protein [Candidatus Marinimicrobia bacterium]|nr:DUF1295 domain-containing protein [Candidatus Neomarinimicrobiota bacterium]
MNAFEITVVMLGASVIISFFYGLFTQNYSTVDRLWSVLPPVYALIWMYGHTHNTRLVFASVLVIAWGIRLDPEFRTPPEGMRSPGKTDLPARITAGRLCGKRSGTVSSSRYSIFSLSASFSSR